jgi:hypothetical protein
MSLQDEVTIREEISQIAGRIDSILNAINQVYPMETLSAPEKKEESDQHAC